MKDKNILTLKIFALIVLNDLLDSVSQLFIKMGLTDTGIALVGFSNFAEFIARNAHSGLVWLGLGIGIANLLLWLIILHRIDLSVALPVGSTIYIFVPLMAIFFLHERVSLLRWAGIFLIVIGIHLVAKSKQSSSEATAKP